MEELIVVNLNMRSKSGACLENFHMSQQTFLHVHLFM